MMEMLVVSVVKGWRWKSGGIELVARIYVVGSASKEFDIFFLVSRISCVS
jgi:hypothetical protein